MRVGSILESVSPRFAMMEGSHSGLVRPPAKRVGGVELPRGFESHSLRQTSEFLFDKTAQWFEPPSQVSQWVTRATELTTTPNKSGLAPWENHAHPARRKGCVSSGTSAQEPPNPYGDLTANYQRLSISDSLFHEMFRTAVGSS